MFPVTVNVTVTVDGVSVCVCVLLFYFCNLLPRSVWIGSVFMLLFRLPLRHSSIIHIDFFFIFLLLIFFPLLLSIASLLLQFAAVNLSKICGHYLLFGGFAFVSLQYACKQLTECHGEMLKLPFSTI